MHMGIDASSRMRVENNLVTPLTKVALSILSDSGGMFIKVTFF
jgi:hypothetical protein